MKKASLAVLVALALLLALPAFAHGQVPGEDSVVGGGSVDLDGSFALSFDVRSGPFGENPTGEVSVRVEPGGPVIKSSSIDCLVVSGSSATLAGTFDPNSYGYTDFGITVEDTGATASAPDLMGFVFPYGAPPGCDPTHLVKLPLITGALVVTDGEPIPTSTDQCKNGGWTSYPGFKNHGQCVAFVQRGPKP